MHKYCALIVMLMHRLYFILDFKAIVSTKSIIDTIMSISKCLKQFLNCWSCHLATKLWHTKYYNLGLKYSISSLELISMCMSFNFFFSSHFFVTIFSWWNVSNKLRHIMFLLLHLDKMPNCTHHNLHMSQINNLGYAL